MSADEFTWLERRWLSPLLESSEHRLSVRRGRVVARKGWVKRLKVGPGLISASVSTDSGGVHEVTVRMDVIDEVWDRAADRIANEGALAADVLGGRITPNVASVFEEEGNDLFPFDLFDLKNFCLGHPDDPVCIDAIAVHFEFARLVTAHPMTLFEFRGRTQAALIEEVRQRRSGGDVTPADDAGAAAASAGVEATDALLEGFWERGVVPHLAFRVERARLSEADALPVVRALGPGPSEIPPEDVVRVLAPLMRTARKRMDAIHERAESEPMEMQAPDPMAAQSLDDILVAAAHQHGSLSSGFVANALGIEPREARQYLKWLVEEGRLLVRGRARGTKYYPIDATDLPDE